MVNVLKKANNFTQLLNTAEQVRLENLGNIVYLRGLIEFSNYCSQDCYYCGIRKSNHRLKRYHLTKEEIINLAHIAYKNGYQSIALQAGEISSEKEVNFLADTIKEIKDITPPSSLSLGITLSTGELSYQQYKKLRDAGAHRYLLRIETSNEDLFTSIHPSPQSFKKRLECLYALKDLDYQVGTGVMVGLPQQTYEDLANDLLFFQEFGIDMIGLGPYIPHAATPLAIKGINKNMDSYTSTLKMLALTRIIMPDINIVASTALQTINPLGLEAGIKAGANIVMPVLTPEAVRGKYALYNNKSYTPLIELANRIANISYEVGLWALGDSSYYFSRTKHYKESKEVKVNE